MSFDVRLMLVGKAEGLLTSAISSKQAKGLDHVVRGLDQKDTNPRDRETRATLPSRLT
jgi:hypothetical protein